MKKLKTKVHYLKPSYDFRPEKGQVICTLDFFINLNEIPCIETLWNNKKFQKLISRFRIYEYYDGTYPDIEMTINGYADTNEGDTFDQEFGRKIALTRAQKKAFKIAREFYYDCFKIISDLIYGNNVTLGLENLSINCHASYNNCHCHIRKLIFQKYENNSI